MRTFVIFVIINLVIAAPFIAVWIVRNNIKRYIGIMILASVYLAPFIMTGFTAMEERRISSELDREGVSTEATVVDAEYVEYESLSATRVTVAFTTVDGTAVRTTEVGDRSYEVGEKFQIEYDPRSPTHVRWEDTDSTWQLLLSSTSYRRRPA